MYKRNFLIILLQFVFISIFINAEIKLSNVELKKIAKNATIYGYPIVDNYRIMYEQSIDTKNPEYKAPINEIKRIASIAGPEDTSIQSINGDTPYAYLRIDLRREAYVLSMPAIEKNRYYSAQIIDLYTQIPDYLGTRIDGNNGGKFLLIGPGWNGKVPEGINRVIKVDTEFAYVIYRTQLFDPQDIENVKKIQSGYTIETLDDFMGRKVKKAPLPEINWLPINREEEAKPEKFFAYLDLMLQFMPVYPDEKIIREDFRKIGIDTGQPFNFSKLTQAQKEAVISGYNEGMKEIDNLSQTNISSSDEATGNHKEINNNYLLRAAVAKGGIYANVKEEALYYTYARDKETDEVYDTGKYNYIFRFEKNQLPLVNAFWSLTMYDGKTLAMIKNPLNRYLINSEMFSKLKKDSDGGVTIYIQKNSPGKDKESNWLPAPDGPIFLALRAYLPKEEMLNGTWKQPLLKKQNNK